MKFLSGFCVFFVLTVANLATAQSGSPVPTDATADLDRIKSLIQNGDFQTASHLTGNVHQYAVEEMRKQGARGELVLPLKYTAGTGNVFALLDILEKTRSAMLAADFTRMEVYATSLSVAVGSEFIASQPSAAVTLEAAEAGSASLTPHQRYLDLPRLTKLAFQSGQLSKSQVWAEELLDMAASHRSDWPQGEAVHRGNDILGRIALANGDVATAKARLLASGETIGSPVLGSFGPSMALAKDLLSAGERAAVVACFDECKNLWKMDRGRLAEWTATVNAGKMPDFGPNLLY